MDLFGSSFEQKRPTGAGGLITDPSPIPSSSLRPDAVPLVLSLHYERAVPRIATSHNLLLHIWLCTSI